MSDLAVAMVLTFLTVGLYWTFWPRSPRDTSRAEYPRATWRILDEEDPMMETNAALHYRQTREGR